MTEEPLYPKAGQVLQSPGASDGRGGQLLSLDAALSLVKLSGCGLGTLPEQTPLAPTYERRVCWWEMTHQTLVGGGVPASDPCQWLAPDFLREHRALPRARRLPVLPPQLSRGSLAVPSP